MKLATLDDAGTVNAATVTYERNGRMIVVDFLDGLSGVSRDQIEGGGMVPLGLLLRGTPTAVNVLHPLLVLKSKISNVVGPLRRLDDGSLNQMRAAPSPCASMSFDFSRRAVYRTTRHKTS